MCDNCGKVQSPCTKKSARVRAAPSASLAAPWSVACWATRSARATGKTVATVGGAAAGGFAGNEVQKNVTSKTVWVT